jgi:hypothetical protein
MQDETEQYRRARQAELNNDPGAREALEAQYGTVWSLEEVRERWEVIGFMAPFVIVKERATGKRGSLEFQHSPRFYWGWVED